MIPFLNKTIVALVFTLTAAPLLTLQAYASDWQRMNADYEVPAPAELSEFARFKINDLRVRDEGGVREFKYTLPRELTGREVEVSGRTNADGETIFSGQEAKLDCVNAVCRVKYPGLELDRNEVEQFLKSKSIGAVELGKRLGVFDNFVKAGDPEGVLYLGDYYP
jgi:hypothetical protein